jgi:DNA polymerase-1
MYPTIEADDILGIHASSGEGIAVSIDKDLLGVHGWYYNPEKNDEPYYISKEDADRWFCIQWMAGDSTDGIPGLWRIGEKTAVKLLDEWEQDQFYENIQEMYAEGKHSPENKYEVDDMALAMARCVRILQDGDYNIEKHEVNLWTPKLGYKKEREI